MKIILHLLFGVQILTVTDETGKETFAQVHETHKDDDDDQCGEDVRSGHADTAVGLPRSHAQLHMHSVHAWTTPQVGTTSE